ncbi:MAG TPA: hypothetical protein O0X38_03940, partial [Methanocorpusculum sp.]|nr:hypothetical protein [Methanocorpusculum sp.]
CFRKPDVEVLLFDFAEEPKRKTSEYSFQKKTYEILSSHHTPCLLTVPPPAVSRKREFSRERNPPLRHLKTEFQ